MAFPTASQARGSCSDTNDLRAWLPRSVSLHTLADHIPGMAGRERNSNHVTEIVDVNDRLIDMEWAIGLFCKARHFSNGVD
jgi:hypothetical protein